MVGITNCHRNICLICFCFALFPAFCFCLTLLIVSGKVVKNVFVYPWVAIYGANTSSDASYRALGDDSKAIKTSAGNSLAEIAQIVKQLQLRVV